MAITHIKYGASGATHDALISAVTSHLEQGKLALKNLIATMALMINGDGTQEAHFTSYVITAFGFPDAATAKAAWDELNSCNAKVAADGSVSFVSAALEQLFNKFRKG